jgi:hypothetical protein
MDKYLQCVDFVNEKLKKGVFIHTTLRRGVTRPLAIRGDAIV